jgi:hypothetical protein
VCGRFLFVARPADVADLCMNRSDMTREQAASARFRLQPRPKSATRQQIHRGLPYGRKDVRIAVPNSL